MMARTLKRRRGLGLRQCQSRFLEYVPVLIDVAHEHGLELTGGDLYRNPRVWGEFGERKGPYGAAKSYHKLRLAIDLNLFNARGQYLRLTRHYRPLGEAWEALGREYGVPLRWGGRWDDGRHFELAFYQWDAAKWPGGLDFWGEARDVGP